MIEIDARGLSCPLPVVRTKAALDKGPDEIRVLVDAGEQVENIRRLSKHLGYKITGEDKDSGVFTITIKKEEANEQV